jgi:hypothetical protein
MTLDFILDVIDSVALVASAVALVNFLESPTMSTTICRFAI